MSDRKKIKVLFHSNYSRMVTGFGKNMRNILLALFNDPDIEIIEAANGLYFGSNVNTPWKSYGTASSDQHINQLIIKIFHIRLKMINIRLDYTCNFKIFSICNSLYLHLIKLDMIIKAMIL